MNDYKNGLRKTKEHWGKEAGTWRIGRGKHWLENIAVRNRINQKVSGQSDLDAYQYLIRFLETRDFFPIERCLTLGCGNGELERGLSKYNFSNVYDAFDISDQSIEMARDIAKKNNFSNINYQVKDINHISLPPSSYDVVFGVMSVHHFLNLEHIFIEVKKSLKDGGIFFLNEFIGPTRFQWTDRQLEIVNGLLRVLPENYRKMQNNKLKTDVKRPSIEQINAIDPSEAIRSDEIIDILSLYFEIVERRDYGGTILHLLLEDIAFNFNNTSKKDMELLNLLFGVEDYLLELGDITSDFSVIIAR